MIVYKTGFLTQLIVRFAFNEQDAPFNIRLFSENRINFGLRGRGVHKAPVRVHRYGVVCIIVSFSCKIAEVSTTAESFTIYLSLEFAVGRGILVVKNKKWW